MTDRQAYLRPAPDSGRPCSDGAYSSGEPQNGTYRVSGRRNAAFADHLDGCSVPSKLFPFEALNIVLVFNRDPDSNRIHVDFPAAEQG